MGFCLQPLPLFARDQNKKDTKEAKSSAHAGKAKPQVAKHAQKANGVAHNNKAITQGGKQGRKHGQPKIASRNAKQNTAAAGQRTNGTKQNITAANRNRSNPKGINANSSNRSVSNIAQQNRNVANRNLASRINTNFTVNNQNIQRTNRSQSQQNQPSGFTVQGNRSNQYNGQWVAGNTHSDWDRNTNHEWNNHDYRWHDGGWLIFNANPTLAYVGSGSPGYYQTGSLVISVKHSLADQGYYNGHFSATVGPRTRQAISNYESDKGLQVNGQIDGPLLASLGLE